MKGIKQFHSLLLFLTLFSFGAAAQSVSSVTIGPNGYNASTVLTATIQGFLPNPCTDVVTTVSVQGSHINIYLEFIAQPGTCAQVVTPFTTTVTIGIVPAGTYTVHCYNGNTGQQMCANQQCVVVSGCLAPTVGHLYASNITATSLYINCTPIPGAVYYQFLYRPVGYGNWYSTPVSSNPYWHITGLSGGTTYEYRVRIYCNGGWTYYSPSQYCSTYNPSSGTHCGNAIVLNCGVTYSGTTNNGSCNYSNYWFPNGVQFTNMTGLEKYHKFTITSTSNVTINLTSLSQNLHLFLLNACNTNCNSTSGMHYSCNSGNNSEQLTVNNLAPGTYIIIVDGYQGAHCNYNLTVNCTPVASCAAPTAGQIFTTNLTSTSVQLNTSAPGVHYDWAYRAPGGSWISLPSSTQNFYVLTGLQPGVTYQYAVAVKCSNYVWSCWSTYCYFTTPHNGPGASCNNPIVVTCGNSYTGNNGGGGYNYYDYYYNGQHTTASGPDVCYKIVVAANTSLTVNLSNLSGDLDLYLLSSCNGNTSVVAESSNSGANNESLTAYNLPAGTYYIVVDGWNGCISNYLLSVICNNNNSGCPYNDNVCGAHVLYSGYSCVTTNGSNSGATCTSNPTAPGGCNTSGMQDVWYAVQMPSTGKMRVTTGAGSLTNALIGIYGGSSCSSNLNCYGCVDNTNGNYMPSVVVTGSPGIWIYLRVWGYNGSYGTFTICVTTLTNGGNSLETSNEPVFAIDAEAASDRAAAGEQAEQEATYALKVYPVPTFGELNFSAQLPADQPVDIRVLDLNGRIVKQLNGLQDTDGQLLERMEVGDLPAGLYLVKVRAGETELTSKFSKL